MPDRLVHIVDDVPELDDLTALTMVLVLDGFLDAGNAAGRAAQHLIDLSEGRVVATFDVDELHDYRARRPPMSFVRDHYASYDAPRLVVRLLADAGDTPYLLLHGPEPDTRWEAFCGAVRDVVARFGDDEFAILLADTDERSAVAFAHRVREQLSEPHPTSHGPQTVGASVGVCAIPGVDQGSSELLRNADQALYAAKAAGKNQVKVFANN